MAFPAFLVRAYPVSSAHEAPVLAGEGTTSGGRGNCTIQRTPVLAGGGGPDDAVRRHGPGEAGIQSHMVTLRRSVTHSSARVTRLPMTRREPRTGCGTFRNSV